MVRGGGMVRGGATPRGRATRCHGATPRLRRLTRQHCRHGGREPRPADSGQRRPRQDLRKCLLNPSNHRRLGPPQPLQPIELNLDSPETRHRRVCLGRNAGAEAGQSIERRLQGRRFGRRVRIEEEGLGREPMGRPKRHLDSNAQF